MIFGKSNPVPNAGLKAFFAENVTPEENLRFVASKRFVGDDGKPVEWVMQCITSDEDESLRKESTKRIPIVGKRGQFTSETDIDLYLGKLAVKCTAFPLLHDADLQNSYGVMGAEALLKKMLLPGEYANYLAKVQEVNGFDVSFEELVDEAKN